MPVRCAKRNRTGDEEFDATAFTAKQIVAARDRNLVDGEGLIVRVKESRCTAG
jgi:hypothetical protein